MTDSPTCDYCGTALANELAKREHERVCDGDSVRGQVDDLLDGRHSGSCVYVLDIGVDGESYLYVGETAAIATRLQGHLADTTIGVPKDGRLVQSSEYEVEGVREIEPIDGDVSRRKVRERERAYELAIETGRTDILGGR